MPDQSDPKKLPDYVGKYVQPYYNVEAGGWADVEHGGAGSGHWGHAGVPGQRGGSAPGDYGTEASPRAHQVARDRYIRSVNMEHKITPILQEAAAKTNGTMKGLDFRLKTEESAADKIYRRSLISRRPMEGVPIHDMNRYTMVYSHDQMVDSVYKTVDDLHSKGWDLKIGKNYYERGQDYHGENCVFKNKDGDEFELQFHTPNGFDIKMKTHMTFEKFRALPATATEERKALLNEMVSLADSDPPPRGWEQLPGMKVHKQVSYA